MSREIPVRVGLRCRPLGPKEAKDGCQSCLDYIHNEPQVILGGKYPFTYDYTFSPSSTQKEVYDNCVKGLLGNVFKGYNVTILAYGQTGSGKTFTMGTACSSSDIGVDDLAGIIPRALTHLYETIENRHEDQTFEVKVSFLEIYKEDILDLLKSSRSQQGELVIREDPICGLKISGLTEKPVTNLSDTLRCLEQGAHLRTTGATAMNSESSRSHAIFTIAIESRSTKSTSRNFNAKLHFVDLAGSERAKKTRAEGNRFKEGVNINLGLLALGNVISALGKSDKNHVPYRESKLTRLLQDSLGGNSVTIMIACVSPADMNFEETLNTLRYADRARKIKNKPIVNRDPQAAEVNHLKELVKQLQLQLLDQKGLFKQFGNETSTCSNELSTLRARNDKLEEENARLNSELQEALDQTTGLYEKVLIAEMARDRLKLKLDELQKNTKNIVESFSQSLNETRDSSLLAERINQLKALDDQVQEIKAEQMRAEEVEIEELSDDDKENEVGIDANAGSNLRRAEINRQISELNKVLAMKQELAERLLVNDEKMNAVKQQYESNKLQLEAEVAVLQNEKDDLQKTLQYVKSNPVSNKISEQRRKRLQELEAQISEYKRKISEFEKMMKMKENSDKRVKLLTQEISELKRTRVKLIRQMKSESERLRQYKLKTDKEVGRLKLQERRREAEISRKQQHFDRQQNVLRKKMEEAVAVNKRLKEALLRQKQNSDKRFKERDHAGNQERVKIWLEHEVELLTSAKEAQHYLQQLLGDRKVISEELVRYEKILKQKTVGSDSNSSSAAESGDAGLTVHELEAKIEEMRRDLELRNIQISDLQQKITDVDTDTKSSVRWGSLQSMMESKLALMTLFDMCVLTKLDVSAKISTYQNLESLLASARETCEVQKGKIAEINCEWEQKMFLLQKEHESKVLFLLQRLPDTMDKVDNSDEALKQLLKLQEEQLKKYSDVYEELQQKIEECKQLERERDDAKLFGTKGPLLPEFTTSHPPMFPPVNSPKPLKIKKKKTKVEETDFEFLDQLSADSEEDDRENDPDWYNTPLMKRIRRLKSNSRVTIKTSLKDDSDFDEPDSLLPPKKKFSEESSTQSVEKSETSFSPPKKSRKRLSDRSTCSCKTGCSSQRCACVKFPRLCSDSCKCGSNCTNKDSSD